MLLQRILDVVMFLGERGLAFRGDSEKIGDTHNGNFLGILELLARYDPLLQEHVGKVKSTQEKGTRLQAHYFSPESQNEFINICAAQVRNHILKSARSQSTLRLWLMAHQMQVTQSKLPSFLGTLQMTVRFFLQFKKDF